MQLMKYCALAALIGALVGTNQARAANLLANAGFENPVTTDGYPFVGSWEAFNGGAGSSSNNSATTPRSGAMDLGVSILNTDNTFAGAFQDVPNLVAGQQVTFSGFHMTSSNPLDLTTEVRIEWRTNTNNDATSTEVSRTANLNPVAGFGQYTPFSLIATVPAGATAARAVYAIQTFSGGPTNNGIVFVDDTSFDVVPEPATMGLLGLGAIGCVTLGRRNRRG
jgi:hypothetical protein